MTAREETDVLVIGGGLVGCAAAYYLAQRHVECLLVERGELNREGSGTNAGSIHLQMRANEKHYPEEVLKGMISTKKEAAAHWAQIEQELGCDLGLKIRGGFLIAETDDDMKIAAEMVEFQRQLGVHVELLTTSELQAICPHFSDRLKGGIFDPAEGSINPLLITPAFARKAERLGGRFKTYTSVTGTEQLNDGGFAVRTNTGEIRARRILNAAGPWAGRLSAMVGVPLPVMGRVIQVNVSERREMSLGQLVGRVAGGLTLKQNSHGSFMMGGGWPATADSRGKLGVDPTNVLGNVGTAMRLLPMLSDVVILRTWPGIIAHSLDTHGCRIQIFGELPGVPGYYVITGGTLLTVGPVMAQQMAELMTVGKTSMSMEIYKPEQFIKAA